MTNQQTTRESEIDRFYKDYPAIASLLMDEFDYPEAKIMAKENYQGCYKNTAEYAEQFVVDMYGIPENLSDYFDYESLGADMESNREIYVMQIEGGSHIFRIEYK